MGGLPLRPCKRIQHVLHFAARLAERHLIISGFGRPRHCGHGALSILLSAWRRQVGRHRRIRHVRFRAAPERVTSRIGPRGNHCVKPLRDIRVRLCEGVISTCGSGHVHITNPLSHIVSFLAEVGIRSVDEFGILRVRRRRKVAKQCHIRAFVSPIKVRRALEILLVRWGVPRSSNLAALVREIGDFMIRVSYFPTHGWFLISKCLDSAISIRDNHRPGRAPPHVSSHCIPTYFFKRHIQLVTDTPSYQKGKNPESYGSLSTSPLTVVSPVPKLQIFEAAH